MEPGKLFPRLVVTLRLLLLFGALLQFIQGRYLGGLATLGILAVTWIPIILGSRFRVRIPSEFELLAVVFIYGSLFLGEVHGYYARFWWWDVVLHVGSGFLNGIFGFVLVYVLNQNDRIEMHLKPGFVAFFAFLFAIGLGTLWEIFEFAMDQTFGLNMQKSGLMDTMWDLIVDTAGALSMALLGYGYMRKAGEESFLERWIQRFIDANPRLFQRRPPRGRRA
jgi:hypothetical protein